MFEQINRRNVGETKTMKRNWIAILLFGTLAACAVAVSWPVLQVAQADTETTEDEESSSEGLMRELMRRAAENGGRLELDSNDPLGKKLFEEMMRGDGELPGMPFGEGEDPFEQMREMMEWMHRGDGHGNDDFRKMFDEMNKQMEQLRKNGGGQFRFHFGPGDKLPADLFKQMRQQQSRRKPSQHEKSHQETRNLYKPVVNAAARGTVRVLVDGKQKALGTVVDPKGFVLTKASELGDYLAVSVQTKDGKPVPATVVGLQEEFDLAMLKVSGSDLKAVEFNRGAPPELGALLATPDWNGEAAATGVVSVAPRKPLGARGFLGIGHEETDDGVRVTTVMPDTAAAKVGIQAGDIIAEVDGEKVDSAMRLVQLVGDRKPGDVVRITYVRQGKASNVKATLGKRQLAGQRQQRFDMMNQMGSVLSQRRDGFPMVLQHDSFLRPEQCGGPLVDLSGKVVGVNIARAGRVESYAIPAADVLALVDDLKSGKLAPPKPDVATRIKEIEERLKQAEAAKSESEKQAERLRRELERLHSQQN
jgi:S1-C subfamily serine protease